MKKGAVGTFNFMQIDFNICPYLRLTAETKFEKVD